jgi:hypothetical protein
MIQRSNGQRDAICCRHVIERGARNPLKGKRS